MSKWLKPSYIFYAVVLMVLSFAIFDYKKEESEKVQKEASSLLFAVSDQLLTKETVDRIELRHGVDTLTLRKDENKKWQISKNGGGMQFLGDDNSIEDWISSLLQEKYGQKIEGTEKAPIQWTHYGLDKPGDQITLSSKEKKVTLELSAKKNFEAKPFLRKNSDNVVLIGGNALDSLFVKTEKDLRDKRLVREAFAGIKAIELSDSSDLAKSKKQPLALLLEKNLWAFKEQMNLRLDQNKVRGLVTALSEMRAQDFVLESDPEAVQLKDYYLQSPKLVVQVTLGERPFTVVFGYDEKQKIWYAWPKELHFVAKVDGPSVEKMNKASLTSLRDREEPFSFKLNEVSHLTATDRKANIDLAKQGENWTSPSKEAVVHEQVKGLLEKMNNLKVAEFMDGKTEDSRLKAPLRQVRLADEQGHEILALQFGEIYKKIEEGKTKERVLVKSSKMKDLFGIEIDDYKELDFGKIFNTPGEKVTK